MNLDVASNLLILKNLTYTNKIKLCKYLDDYYKYNIKNPYMSILLNNYDFTI